jgi:hypothetical protein
MQNKPFTDVRITPGYFKGRVVHWTIDPVFKEEGPYNFTLETSEDPKFSELTHSFPVGDTYYAIDDEGFVEFFPDSYLYRVKLETNKNVYYSKSLFFDSTIEDKHKYLMAQEIVRREILRLKQYAGSIGWLLKRKILTPIYPKNIDSVSGVSIANNEDDFGTTHIGGYYPPLKILYSREDHEDTLKLNEEGLGITQDKKMTTRMVGFPLVTPRDVLVTLADERYSFNKVQSRYYPGTGICIVQNSQLIAISTSDPVYRIPIPYE